MLGQPEHCTTDRNDTIGEEVLVRKEVFLDATFFKKNYGIMNKCPKKASLLFNTPYFLVFHNNMSLKYSQFIIFIRVMQYFLMPEKCDVHFLIHYVNFALL